MSKKKKKLKLDRGKNWKKVRGERILQRGKKELEKELPHRWKVKGEARKKYWKGKGREERKGMQRRKGIKSEEKAELGKSKKEERVK